MDGRLSPATLLAVGLAVGVSACGSPKPPARASGPSPAPGPAVAPQPTSVPQRRLEPILVGDTGAIAAQAVADTRGQAIGRAVVALANNALGRPHQAFSLDQSSAELLRLDLTRFDSQLFVEQVLALANSRGGQTPSDTMRRFGDHVRRLRYDDGQVAYCHRHHYFSRWAEAAERQGYAVNLTPYLPGALNRTVRLNWMSQHHQAYAPLRQPANRACITALEQVLSVRQSYVPLAQLGPALASVRDGDIFALVTRLPGLDVTHVGLLTVRNGRVSALHAAPGRGVIRSDDLARYAAGVPDVVGVMVLRPMPNPDGRAGG